MKYKVGDNVRYDGGDWWLYGTVSAVFEHSICPFYRINVERMVKKSCKFSITQFEFDLEAYHEEDDISKDKRKWENSEIEDLKKYYGVLNREDLSKVLKRSSQAIEDKWRQIKPAASEPVEAFLTAVSGDADEKIQITMSAEPVEKPERKQRRKRKPKLEAETEKTESTQVPEKKRRGKRGEAWNRNLEMYRNGEKSNTISTWMAQNRREYRTGKLPEKKFEKLMEISFPFDVVKKKRNDNWDQRFEEWKKGERRSKLVQQWRQRSIKQYTEGKLSMDRIAMLKEIGILK